MSPGDSPPYEIEFYAEESGEMPAVQWPPEPIEGTDDGGGGCRAPTEITGLLPPPAIERGHTRPSEATRCRPRPTRSNRGERPPTSDARVM
jgi:hypothetical protein